MSEEPTREEAYAGLMRLYALVGNIRPGGEQRRSARAVRAARGDAF